MSCLPWHAPEPRRAPCAWLASVENRRPCLWLPQWDHSRAQYARARATEPLLPEITARLQCMHEVGLGWTLDRRSDTLSGEAQRLRLAAQLGSICVVCYVLDRPLLVCIPATMHSCGHTAPFERPGNSIVVVGDEETIRQADHVIDLGPGAGKQAGRWWQLGRAELVQHPPPSPGAM